MKISQDMLDLVDNMEIAISLIDEKAAATNERLLQIDHYLHLIHEELRELGHCDL